MRRFAMPVTSAEAMAPHCRAVGRVAQPVTATATLVVLIWAIANGFSPRQELWLLVVPLALGLLAGPLAQRATGWSAHRVAQPVAAFAVLLILTLWLPSGHSPGGPVPLWVVVLLLGLGLVAEPLAQVASGQPIYGYAQSLAALAAMLVMFWVLSIDAEVIDRLPLGSLRVVLVLLSFVLVAGQLERRPAVRRLLQLPATVVALVYLLLTLAYPPASGISPEWPLWWMAALLGAGLLVGLIAQLGGGPRAKVLSERVNELSRTRRGVLDVQATELRRIERDIHDGAQVRLVALSMKLGRAEDRYRDDPETAALLREAREDATAAIRELRELARGISPPVLADRGLEAAVRSLAQRSGADVTVSGRLRRRPLPAVETAAYFVVAESLTNAAKHALGARVEVRLDERGGDLFVEITDFGPGGADPAGGGLTGLRQRVEALDGALHLTSPAGVGTQVEAVMSCGW
jgi:signal transduction histidine kinase